jgi:hypothetical protein
VVLVTLDVVLAVVEVTELVELVLVVAVNAAASALSKSEAEEIIETDTMASFGDAEYTSGLSIGRGQKTFQDF